MIGVNIQYRFFLSNHASYMQSGGGQTQKLHQRFRVSISLGGIIANTLCRNMHIDAIILHFQILQ